MSTILESVETVIAAMNAERTKLTEQIADIDKAVAIIEGAAEALWESATKLPAKKQTVSSIMSFDQWLAKNNLKRTKAHSKQYNKFYGRYRTYVKKENA